MATPTAKSAAEVNSAQAGEMPDVVYLGNKKVRARYKVRASEGSTQYTAETVFDYSGCTEEQLYFLANASVVIKQQAKLRDAIASNPKFDPSTVKTVDVMKDVITSTSRDPAAVAIIAAQKAGLSPAVIEAMRAEFAKAAKK